MRRIFVLASSCSLLLSALLTGKAQAQACTQNGIPCSGDQVVAQPYIQAQVMLGKCFVLAIPLTTVSIGSYLNVVISNPAGSGETFIIYERQFSQTTNGVLKYTFVTNPTAITGTTKSPSNQLTGNANTSAVTMTYAVQSTPLTGTLVGEMPIPPNGQENPVLTTTRTLPPGTSLGYQFGGTGGVLSAASAFTFNANGCKL